MSPSYKKRPLTGCSIPPGAGFKVVMVALTFILLLLTFRPFSILAWASPAGEIARGHKSYQSIFCSTVKASWLCPRDGTIIPDVQTSLGTAHGTLDGSAVRFAVKYANAERWQESKVASTWALPNNLTDVTAMPLGCPQDSLDEYTEDCLSMVLYVPTTATVSASMPILMWIHGGSFYSGSANDAGLTGSNLATATNSIVAVIQYRLGALGFMAPDGTTNLAVKDTINAMKFLHTIASPFGGSASKITLAGQSSGANMIRALLATPSASNLFTSAILHSDPMNYGFLSTSTQEILQTYFNTAINCSSSDTACWNSLSLSDVLSAQSDLLNSATSLDESSGASEPIRVVQDGSLITSPLDDTAPFPSVDKSILVTTVQNEAGATIYNWFDTVLTDAYFSIVSTANLGAARTATITNSVYYPPMANIQGVTDARVRLEKLGTDQMWRCSGWTFARNWAANGGTVYTGLFTLGSPYSGNSHIDFCYQNNSVCHQADIEIVFGTAVDPSSEQSALIEEIQARYKAFLYNGAPNPTGYGTWAKSGSIDVNVLNLGGTSTIDIGACDISFWGDSVPYDYQVYGI